MILYCRRRPAGARWRGCIDGCLHDARFCPPSAFAHPRAMYGEVVHRRDPETVTLPMDVTFLNELAVIEARLCTTRELTCSSSMPAWQRELLAAQDRRRAGAAARRIEERSQFSAPGRAEWKLPAGRGVRPVLCDRGAANRKGSTPETFIRRNRRFKGVDPKFAPDASAPRRADRLTSPANRMIPFSGTSWRVRSGGTFRSSGLSPSARPSTFRSHSTAISPSRVQHDRDPAPRADRRRQAVSSWRSASAVTSTTTADGTFILEGGLRQGGCRRRGSRFGITIDAGAVVASDRRRPRRGHALARRLAVAARVELSPLVDQPARA